MIHIRCCTSKPKDKQSETQLFQSITDWPFSIIAFTSNTDGLPEMYNKCITKNMKDNDILVLCHDDIKLNESDETFEKKIYESLKRFDIIGLAGTSSWTLKSPAVWNNSDKTKWSGAVRHSHEDNEWMTNFGPIGKKCIILDGLFLAMKAEVLKKVQFDEQFMFHHYDMDFCLSAHKAGLTMGTVPIDVTHYSIGDWTKDPSWYESEKKFIEKWTPKS